MSNTFLKPIKTLKVHSDLRSFSYIRPLQTSEFFPSCFDALFELISIQQNYSTLLELFIKTVYFFPSSSKAQFEKKHSNFIKALCNSLESANSSKIQKNLSSPLLWNLLKDLEKSIPPDSESYIAPLTPLLKFLKINIVEKADGYEDTVWSVPNAYFTIHIFETETEMFLLHPSHKIEFCEVGENDEKGQESLVLAEADDTLLPCRLETEETVLESSFNDEEVDWTETLMVLNNGKNPFIRLEGQMGKKVRFEELRLGNKELDLFIEGYFVDKTEFLKDFTLNVLRILVNAELFHIALSVFINTLFFFKQAQNKRFEQKNFKITQEFTSVLNSNDKPAAEKILLSEKMAKVLQEIQNFVTPCEDSLIFPLFPLLQTWKMSLQEKNHHSEYYWKVKNSLFALTLYEKNHNLYLLAPKQGLHIKKLKIFDEDLQIQDSSQILQQENLETELDFEYDSILESSLDFQNQSKIVPFPFSPSPSKKIVKFKPDLEIQIPSPTTPNIIHSKKSISPIQVLPKNPVGKPPRPSNPSKPPVHQSLHPTRSKNLSTDETLTSSFSNKPMQITEKPQKRKLRSYDGSADIDLRPATFCGAFSCQSCIRDLVKSSHFLFNSQTWSLKLNDAQDLNLNKKFKKVENGNECGLCGETLIRKIPIFCIACFLFRTVWKDGKYTEGDGCRMVELNEWIDVRSGKEGEMEICSYCCLETRREFVFQACDSCEDVVCVVCLRKNEYLAGGVCSNCHSRRLISVLRR